MPICPVVPLTRPALLHVSAHIAATFFLRASLLGNPGSHWGLKGLWAQPRTRCKERVSRNVLLCPDPREELQTWARLGPWSRREGREHEEQAELDRGVGAYRVQLWIGLVNPGCLNRRDGSPTWHSQLDAEVQSLIGSCTEHEVSHSA